MDERWIGALSGAGVILGLAIVQALPHRRAVRAQEVAKWFIAATLVVGGAAYWDEQGSPSLFVLALLTVTAWQGHRWRMRQRLLRPERLPPSRS